MATIKVARSSLPIKRSISIVAGDDFISDTITHKSPAGASIDMSGYIISGQIVLPKEADPIALDFELDLVNGSYTPVLDKINTATLDDQIGTYEIDVTDTLGKKTTYFYGIASIKRTL